MQTMMRSATRSSLRSVGAPRRSSARVPGSTRTAAQVPLQRVQAIPNNDSPSITKLIKEEHDSVRSLFSEYKSIKGDDERKQNLAWWIIRVLSKHAVKEELVFYPAVRQKLGNDYATRALEEHRELKRTLNELDGMKLADEGYDSMLRKAITEFEQHAADDEEKDMLPRFEKAEGVTAEYLADLGKTFTTIDAAIPGRPHPLAPDTFPLNLPNAAVTPIDAVRDFARFGTATPTNPQEQQ